LSELTIKLNSMLRIIRKVEEVLREPYVKPHHIRCIVCDISDSEKKEFEITLTNKEVELIEMLNSIQEGANLYAPIMNELWDKIQQYSNMKFTEGKTDK